MDEFIIMVPLRHSTFTDGISNFNIGFSIQIVDWCVFVGEIERLTERHRASTLSIRRHSIPFQIQMVVMTAERFY